jgi:hypothetical protein
MHTSDFSYPPLQPFVNDIIRRPTNCSFAFIRFYYARAGSCDAYKSPRTLPLNKAQHFQTTATTHTATATISLIMLWGEEFLSTSC